MHKGIGASPSGVGCSCGASGDGRNPSEEPFRSRHAAHWKGVRHPGALLEGHDLAGWVSEVKALARRYAPHKRGSLDGHGHAQRPVTHLHGGDIVRRLCAVLEGRGKVSPDGGAF